MRERERKTNVRRKENEIDCKVFFLSFEWDHWDKRSELKKKEEEKFNHFSLEIYSFEYTSFQASDICTSSKVEGRNNELRQKVANLTFFQRKT